MKRLHAIYGWQPVGIILAIILLFSLVVDHFAVQYLDFSEESETLAKKTRDMKSHVDRLKKTEILLQERRDLLVTQRNKGYAAATPEQAGAALVADVQGMLNAAHAKQAAVQPLPPSVADGFAIIQADASFDVLTQQLVTLLENIAQAPKPMKINELKVGIVETDGHPSALNVHLTLQSFHADPTRDAKPATGRRP